MIDTAFLCATDDTTTDDDNHHHHHHRRRRPTTDDDVHGCQELRGLRGGTAEYPEGWKGGRAGCRCRKRMKGFVRKSVTVVLEENDEDDETDNSNFERRTHLTGEG